MDDDRHLRSHFLLFSVLDGWSSDSVTGYQLDAQHWLSDSSDILHTHSLFHAPV